MMNAEISETIRVRPLRFGEQIPELLTQRKFDSAECHAHSNAHKPPKTTNYSRGKIGSLGRTLRARETKKKDVKYI